jgi:putative lipoprotein
MTGAAPTAHVTVTLADVSLADAPAQVISRQVIVEPGQPPIPFELRYDPATIIPNHTYAVQARIEDGGRLLFISASANHVITRGAPAEVEVWVERVSQPPDQ